MKPCLKTELLQSSLHQPRYTSQTVFYFVMHEKQHPPSKSLFPSATFLPHIRDFIKIHLVMSLKTINIFYRQSPPPPVIIHRPGVNEEDLDPATGRCTVLRVELRMIQRKMRLSKVPLFSLLQVLSPSEMKRNKQNNTPFSVFTAAERKVEAADGRDRHTITNIFF